MIKSASKKILAPKGNPIFGKNKNFDFSKNLEKFWKIEIFFLPKIGFFFGAKKKFGVDLSTGRPTNRIFFDFFTSDLCGKVFRTREVKKMRTLCHINESGRFLTILDDFRRFEKYVFCNFHFSHSHMSGTRTRKNKKFQKKSI